MFAKSIAVDGETKGDLYASERVSVHVNARVQGNIIAPKVSIEEGARFKGSIEMDPAAVDKALKALGKTAASITDNPAAQNTPNKNLDTKAAPKKVHPRRRVARVGRPHGPRPGRALPGGHGGLAASDESRGAVAGTGRISRAPVSRSRHATGADGAALRSRPR